MLLRSTFIAQIFRHLYSACARQPVKFGRSVVVAFPVAVIHREVGTWLTYVVTCGSAEDVGSPYDWIIQAPSTEYEGLGDLKAGDA